MKVLLINGSPKKEGNTFIALSEVQKTLEAEGIETELIHVGHKDIHGCIACNRCVETGKCAFNDIVNEVAEKFKEADGIVVGSPVYYASPNAARRRSDCPYMRNASPHISSGRFSLYLKLADK